MSKLLLLLIFFIMANGLAQSGDSLKKNLVKHPLVISDSILVNPGTLKDSMLNTIPASDSFMINDNIERNITGILELQKSQQAREKRNAITRIGIGLAFLIILIIGLRRKTVKK